MGMFGDLMNKIFHHAGVAERPPDAWVPPPPVIKPAAPGASAAHVAAAPAATAAATMTEVDVTAALDNLAAASKEKLDWRHSIVDLMKLVGMDSSLAARRDLAADLKYTGDTKDTATMNISLHKQVMVKLAENGGKVPADLLS